MILSRLDALNWSFILRSKSPFSDLEFKTTSLFAVLQIMYPGVKPLKGEISFQQFENNDIIGALSLLSEPSVISILKYYCIQILNTHIAPPKWNSILSSFIQTNCIHFSISGNVTKVNRLFELNLKILFSKLFTAEYKREKFLTKAIKW